MERIEDRVHRLESSGSKGSSLAPKKRAERHVENTPQSWADHDLCDCTGCLPMEWSDNEDAEEKDLSPPVSLSEDDRTLISSSFTKVLPNLTRRKVRDTFPLSDLKETYSP